jgi:hypothetical protein
MTSYAYAISFAKICLGNGGYDGMRAEVLLRKIALCILLASVLVACRGDRNEYSYQTLADADKAGEIARGWIPDDLMPSSSRAIRLVEELSPSREWCAFEFLPADSQNLKKNLKSVDTLPPSVRRVRSPGVSWWPAVLKGNLDVERIHKEGFELYVVERPANSVNTGIYLFALDRSKGRGFFHWTYE